MKTYVPDNNSTEQNWVVVDASDVPLGRLATLIASRIRGKHRPDFTPNIMNGDFVVVVNAEKVALTGKKMDQKRYYHHSHFPGGLKEITLSKQIEKDATQAVIHAIRGMLPVNKLRDERLARLKVYNGSEHKHAPQQPTPFSVKPEAKEIKETK